MERVIASCKLSTPLGKRDRAILLLLARLGVRAGDTVQLHSADIDGKWAWITVCGKIQRATRFPLTQPRGRPSRCGLPAGGTTGGRLRRGSCSRACTVSRLRQSSFRLGDRRTSDAPSPGPMPQSGRCACTSSRGGRLNVAARIVIAGSPRCCATVRSTRPSGWEYPNGGQIPTTGRPTSLPDPSAGARICARLATSVRRRIRATRLLYGLRARAQTQGTWTAIRREETRRQTPLPAQRPRLDHRAGSTPSRHRSGSACR